jgi:hypothetical protein
MKPEAGSTKKILIAKTLLWVAAAATLGATISAIPNVVDASSATKVVEVWRAIGFATFAGLFALLAWRPLGNNALWAIVIFNKLALVTAGIIFVGQGGINGVADVLVFDGGLVLFLLMAFILTHWPQTQETIIRD